MLQSRSHSWIYHFQCFHFLSGLYIEIFFLLLFLFFCLIMMELFLCTFIIQIFNLLEIQYYTMPYSLTPDPSFSISFKTFICIEDYHLFHHFLYSLSISNHSFLSPIFFFSFSMNIHLESFGTSLIFSPVLKKTKCLHLSV